MQKYFVVMVPHVTYFCDHNIVGCHCYTNINTQSFSKSCNMQWLPSFRKLMYYCDNYNFVNISDEYLHYAKQVFIVKHLHVYIIIVTVLCYVDVLSIVIVKKKQQFLPFNSFFVAFRVLSDDIMTSRCVTLLLF